MVNDSLMANVFRHNAQRRPDVLLTWYIHFFLYPANRITHNVLWQRKHQSTLCDSLHSAIDWPPCGRWQQTIGTFFCILFIGPSNCAIFAGGK